MKREVLAGSGFTGFLTIADLRRRLADSVPKQGGVYVITRDEAQPAKFLPKSTGGWFKGKDPSVSEGELLSAWVPDARTLYVGQSVDLRRRLRLYLDFGLGKSVAHYGGRLIWQIEGAHNLLVAWRASETPVLEEQRLLEKFAAVHGRLPFANLRR